MKKLVLLLAVAFSVSMFSCGGGEGGAATDSDSVKDTVATTEDQKEAPAPEVQTPAPDTTATDSVK